jgi:NAD(P) transhydrogenase subunit alpha
MDALSSMGAIGGYKSALIAADSLGRYMPMMTTAAGTTKAAKAMILGVGVAGLQAIATMRRLGAEVEAFDIRPEVKEQVQSLGARFIDAEDEASEDDAGDDGDEAEEREPSTGEKLAGGLRALFGLPERREKDDSKNGGGPEGSDEKSDQDDTDEDEDTGGYAREQSEEKQQRDRELLARRITEMDVVLTTAQVPGRKAPILLTTDMVESMKPGSVVVDLAAEQGGNCELTEPGEVVSHEQVRIHGPVDVPSSMPIHASQLLSRNMASLLSHLFDDGELELDFDDQITNDACISHEGELRHERTREALESSESS